MRAAVLVLISGLLLTACDFSPGAMAGDEGGGSSGDISSPVLIEPVLGGTCPAETGWYAIPNYKDPLPSVCDPMWDGFPRIETEGTDGSLKPPRHSLTRGGFPELGDLSYLSRPDHLFELKFECGAPKDSAPRREIFCKPVWPHPITPGPADSE